ncbi:MAG: hypothetical protein EBQ85_05685 [Proteobacteria bacterium]|nr:hypothetical protein [Pseudomonadota bacterium]
MRAAKTCLLRQNFPALLVSFQKDISACKKHKNLSEMAQSSHEKRAHGLHSLISMKRMLLPWIFVAQLWAAESPLVPSAEFYSEGSYRSTSAVLSDSVFARAFMTFSHQFQPFVQVGTEHTLAEQERLDLYISPGLKLNTKLLKLFAEHRLHQTNIIDSIIHEWRLLLVVGRTVALPTHLHPRIYALWEPYGELLLSNNEDNNVLFQGFSRVGLRYQLSSTTGTDLFIEPFVSSLQNNIGHTTSFQIRPSMRAQTCFDRICLNFSVARLLSLGQEPDQGFRFLAAIGGSI